MTDNHAVAALAGVGALVFGAMVARSLWTGHSYINNPPMKVFRASDPLSFWLSLLAPAAIALVFGTAALSLLFGKQ